MDLTGQQGLHSDYLQNGFMVRVGKTVVWAYQRFFIIENV